MIKAAAYGFVAGLTAPFLWSGAIIARSPYARRVLVRQVRSRFPTVGSH